jgi:acetaldehyde dehydrogenase (acetylating)
MQSCSGAEPPLIDDAAFDLEKESSQKECEASINALLDGWVYQENTSGEQLHPYRPGCRELAVIHLPAFIDLARDSSELEVWNA